MEYRNTNRHPILNCDLEYADGVSTGSVHYNFLIVPEQGTYYLRNVGTNKYADVKGPSTSSGALIHQWDFHTSNQEKWIIEYVPNSGGYIRFNSAYSNLYLGIDPSNTTVVGGSTSDDSFRLTSI